MWGLYSCENMCPLDLREALCPLYNEYYKKVTGSEENPPFIPFSLDFSAVFTGKQRPPYVKGKFNPPPTKAIHFYAIKTKIEIVKAFLRDVYSPTKNIYPLKTKIRPTTCLLRRFDGTKKLTTAIDKIVEAIETQRKFPESLEEATNAHFTVLNKRHSEFNNANIRSLIFRIKHDGHPLIVAIKRDPVHPSHHKFSYHLCYKEQAENLIRNLCPYLVHCFKEAKNINTETLLKLATKEAQNEFADSTWNESTRMIRGTHERNEELLEAERLQLITSGIISADVPMEDHKEDITALMGAHDDVSTIRSSGDSIASRASMGTTGTINTIGTTRTTASTKRKVADLTQQIEILKTNAALQPAPQITAELMRTFMASFKDHPALAAPDTSSSTPAPPNPSTLSK